MTTTTLPARPAPAPPSAPSGFARLLRSEWTKIRSVRSTAWSLAALVVAGVGLNTLIVAIAMANWSTTSAATKHQYAADPTGFLAAALGFGEIPLCVLGALVITSEYATGMISSSVLAVPRRTPMLAAKVVVFTAVALVAGEILAFASFLIAQAIIGHRLPESLGDASTLRAVFGVGLYLAVLGLMSLAIGAIVRHTAAAITVVIGVLVVLTGLASLLPGTVGQHIDAYLPTRAGMMITHAHQEATDLLSPWAGFGVFCLWTALALGAAVYLLRRRDV
ncbi:MAG: ABC transporter permease subunit [Kitasatospora sp.]|jgi:ABC-type transport system involved in multi-copper enzyme maturation permease subunit|nr:ABC transporter permease subunit [Kitasatospora sp.]